MTAFNARIRRFPGNLIAGMIGLERRDYFQIKEEAREVPRVEF